MSLQDLNGNVSLQLHINSSLTNWENNLYKKAQLYVILFVIQNDHAKDMTDVLCQFASPKQTWEKYTKKRQLIMLRETLRAHREKTMNRSEGYTFSGQFTELSLAVNSLLKQASTTDDVETLREEALRVVADCSRAACSQLPSLKGKDL